MAKNIIILGAGASAGYGAPVMRNFLDMAQRIFAEGRTRKHRESFERVFAAISKLQAVHSKSQLDIVNLESVFTAFELAKTLESFPGATKDEISQIIDDLKWVITTTLENTIQFPVIDGGIVRPHPDVERFIDSITKNQPSQGPHNTAILSFNYDVLIEMGFLGTGFGVDYGIAKQASTSKHIPLLKLHGSLNWTTNSENGEIVPLFISDYVGKIDAFAIAGAKSVPMPVTESLGKIRPNDIQTDGKPFIVPPSWNKADSHRTISNVWSRAAKELSEASSIYIVGYSLPETDTFFRQLYALGTVGETLLKRFWVFNPDPSREAVFRSMLGPGAQDRFRFFPLDFSNSISVIEDGLYDREPKQIVVIK